MKTSIAIILIVIVGVFGFVSGYSIGYKNGSRPAMVEVVGGQPVQLPAEQPAAAGGYGGGQAEGAGAAAPGYGK